MFPASRARDGFASVSRISCNAHARRSTPGAAERKRTLAGKTPQNSSRRVRKSHDDLRHWLDKLDDQTAGAAAVNARRSDRYEYRVRSLAVELEQSGTGWIKYEVPSRNLSREGVAFLIGNFVYPGTTCRVHLVSLQNQRQTVNGRVVRCRYLEESGSLHEAGVHFDNPIDVGTFNRGAARLRFLMIDDDLAMHKLVGHLLGTLDVELTHVDNGRAAIGMVTTSQFDLILLDMDLPEFDGFQTARELRKRGFARSIVAFTAMSGENVKEECTDAGCSSFLPKPVTMNSLIDLIESLKENPLVSTLADDPEMADLIDSFVMDLPEKVGRLETLFAEQQYSDLARIVRMLKGEGGAYGFQEITDTATEAEHAIAEVTDTAEIRSKLNELIRVCLSARSTRGAD